VVRAAALLATLAALALYSALAEKLPDPSNWIDVIFLSTLILPLTFAPVWLALPWRERVGTRGLIVAAVLAVVLAVLLSFADLEIAANIAKLAAATLVGWWFLTFFEAPWWVLLVALLIVPVDLFSVARGPTRKITEEEPQVFDALSVFVAVPGEKTVAQLGLPDVLFFALFLGACARFGLRRNWTWLAMTVSFGVTLALAVYLEEAGVAALPLLSAAFVLANADRLWRSIRQRRSAPSS
jgi:hypothetical protein